MSAGVARKTGTKAMVLALLAVFLGWAGIDRFVNGNIVAGVLKLLTIGGFGIWWLIDICIFTWRAYRTWRDSASPAAASLASPVAGELTAPEEYGEKHVPPRPRGRAVEPWIRVSRKVEVAGEAYYDESYEQILAGQSRYGGTVRVDVTAELYPDPYNPHSEHGNAISVWIDGLHGGYIPSALSGQYSPKLRQMAEQDGTYLRVPALVTATYLYSKSRWVVETTLGLPSVDNLQPRNGMPAGDLEVLPAGRAIQVTKESEHMDALGPLTIPGEVGAYAATLRPSWSGARGTVRTVEVLIDGDVVGEFGAQSGGQTFELAELIIAAGRVPVVRATVEGNPLKAEVVVRMPRSHEVDHDFIAQLQKLARERNASTNHRGEAFEWDDEPEPTTDEAPAT